ncbi:MAG: ATP-binding cassette domain-containing protein [Gammaproteobacteria bacterium]
MRQSISRVKSASGLQPLALERAAYVQRAISPTILPLRLVGVCFEAGGQRLLHDLSFTLQGGGASVILGPNGAGKSLLLKLCHGVIEPTRGQRLWEGPDGARASQRQAMMFQRPVVLRRSVAANIAYALRLRKVPRSERAARLKHVLDLTGLAPLAHRHARVLSGGEQQRLALARAWATQPEVLFLDEPTANLDPAATCAVEDLITTIRSSGLKIVMTTHDLGQARRLGDEVLFLHHGRLIERGDAGPFFEQPARPEARAFIRGELLW